MPRGGFVASYGQDRRYVIHFHDQVFVQNPCCVGPPLGHGVTFYGIFRFELRLHKVLRLNLKDNEHKDLSLGVSEFMTATSRRVGEDRVPHDLGHDDESFGPHL